MEFEIPVAAEEVSGPGASRCGSAGGSGRSAPRRAANSTCSVTRRDLRGPRPGGALRGPLTGAADRGAPLGVSGAGARESPPRTPGTASPAGGRRGRSHRRGSGPGASAGSGAAPKRQT